MPDNQNKNFANIVAGLPVVGQIASGVISAVGQGAANKKQRRFAREMYKRQREDALADWALQNEYNSPREQMRRLQEAGLNPHLVYGGGSGVTEAGGIRTSDTGSYNPKNVFEDVPATVMGIYDMEIKRAQVDNLTKQNTVLQKEAELKEAQRLSTLIGTTGQQVKIDQDKLQLELDRQLFDTNIEFKRKAVDNLQASIVETYNRVDIAKAMKQPNIDLAMQHILNAKKDALIKGKQIENIDANTRKTIAEIDEIGQRIHNMFMDGQLKAFELRLKLLRDKAADWPGWLKAGNDIITDIMDLLKIK